MREFLQEAILPHNMPFTILLGCVILYWLIAMLGALDFEMLDGLLQVDTEIDGDASVEGADSNDGETGGPGIIQSMMNFMNASDVPIILVLSLLTLFTWAANLLGNHYLNPSHDGMIAAAVAFGAIIVGVLSAKWLTIPLKPFGRMIKSAEKQEPVIGRSGFVRSPNLDHEFGQVEVEAEGAPLLLNARLSVEGKSLPKGTSILVVAKEENSDWYTVRSLKPESEITS